MDEMTMILTLADGALVYDVGDLKPAEFTALDAVLGRARLLRHSVSPGIYQEAGETPQMAWCVSSVPCDCVKPLPGEDDLTRAVDHYRQEVDDDLRGRFARLRAETFDAAGIVLGEASNPEPAEPPRGSIRERRKKTGWTLRDLAERAGCSASEVSEAEYGTVSSPVVKKVTAALDAAEAQFCPDESLDRGDLDDDETWGLIPDCTCRVSDKLLEDGPGQRDDPQLHSATCACRIRLEKGAHE